LTRYCLTLRIGGKRDKATKQISETHKEDVRNEESNGGLLVKMLQAE
jgi:hypothetical protein